MRNTITETLMPFTEHLDELRRRMIHGILGLVPIFAIALWFGEDIVSWMVHPLLVAQAAAGLAQKTQATGPLETFNTYLKVSFIATLIVGGPWLLYQGWLFVAPGLYQKERRFVYILAPFSAVMGAAGVAFMFYVMLPIMLLFFVTFGSDIAPRHVVGQALPQGVTLPSVPALESDPIDPPAGSMWINKALKTMRVVIGKDAEGKPQIYEMPLASNSTVDQNFRIVEYVGLVLGMALAFAVAFQMPVLVLLLGWLGIISPEWLGKYRRHAIFVCGFAAAAVTPTGDPLSMALLGVPLYALYELGVVLIRVLPASRVRGAGGSKSTGGGGEEGGREPVSGTAGVKADTNGDGREIGGGLALPSPHTRPRVGTIDPAAEDAAGALGDEGMGGARPRREADSDDEA